MQLLTQEFMSLTILNCEKMWPSFLDSTFSTWQSILTAGTDAILGSYQGCE
jgi:hypothetical protein